MLLKSIILLLCLATFSSSGLSETMYLKATIIIRIDNQSNSLPYKSSVFKEVICPDNEDIFYNNIKTILYRGTKVNVTCSSSTHKQILIADGASEYLIYITDDQNYQKIFNQYFSKKPVDSNQKISGKYFNNKIRNMRLLVRYFGLPISICKNYRSDNTYLLYYNTMYLGHEYFGYENDFWIELKDDKICNIIGVH